MAILKTENTLADINNNLGIILHKFHNRDETKVIYKKIIKLKLNITQNETFC